MKHVVPPVSLYSRLSLTLLCALAVVLLIGFLSYRSWISFDRHTEQLEATQQLISGINALLLSLTDAETGQRGFLLTGDERYLEPYRQARTDIPVLLKSLGTASLAHPDQAQRFESLNPLVTEKLEELEQTIQLRRSQSLDAALAVVRTGRGERVMDQVRRICLEIQTAAIAHQTHYFEEARASGNEGALISILGSTGLFVLLLVASIKIQRGVARRQSLIGELQKSERRLEHAAAEADAANQAKSTFLSTISHEIRTPMNAILGYAQLMLRDPSLRIDAKANLKIIGQSGEHLLALINDVLDMSKIEAGRTELNPVIFNLSRLLDDLASMFRLRAKAKGLRFEMLVDGESEPYIAADEGKIRQVLINLLGNALKFTERGQIKLHVTLDQRSTNWLCLSARVEDTGVGIEEGEQEKVFEPFSQIKHGLYAQEGTGLGLALSRKYARLMGGDITVTSSAGKGAIFRFEIPIERGDSGVAVRRSAPRRVIGIRAGSEVPRILVVDDSRENRDWLMKLLTSIGFSVRGADNGEAAVRNWEEWSPRLIFMDVRMPVMDGLEATRRIKAAPRGKETVIIALTASAMDDDRRAALQSGADNFVTKPCHEEELLDKMMPAFLNIAYDYAEMSENEGQPFAGTARLSAERLGQLPRMLIEEIRNATFCGNKKLLDKLILKVRETEDAGFADALGELADKYDYDALTKLLEEA
jgi:signal transduction histidine kinase/FixJ family two-component response regulator